MRVALGAHAGAGETQFAVRARDADSVWLCLFDDADRETRVAMTQAADIYSATIAGIGPGRRYGYRAAGTWLPERSLLFDPAKLLVDPYATTLDRPFVFDPVLAMHGEETAGLVPKAVVPAPRNPVAPQAPKAIEGGLIYELNVRSFTRRHPAVPAPLRGTIGALAHPAIIAHLQKLRVSAIELMPVVAWIDERHLPPLGLHNAWGYNPVVPMALDPRLAPGGVTELRDTVSTLHNAGIGVILDLVFNHTGESDLLGPTLSLRGLDNRCYSHTSDGMLINDTGTGNTLNGSDPIVRALILDTLRHFVLSCGVDGFRFDLAPVLARGPGFDRQAPIFDDISRDPVLADRILIAEPWDVGPGGYQLGNFPGNWLEWNDRYRDDVRRFWRGDARTLGTLATRMMGSSDIFKGVKSRGIHYIASHDGFTLADLVAHEERHNEANGEDNRDGQRENFSWNNGVEGVSDDAGILARRHGDVRALLATLFASKGTIQLTAGDEFGRSQRGNNNAYAQDNPISWIDWDGRDKELEDFVKELAEMRAARPEIGDPHFHSDASWRTLSGEPMTTETWDDAQAAGFELNLPICKDRMLVIRVDRIERQCDIHVKSR